MNSYASAQPRENNPLARPMTGSGNSNAKVIHLENLLKEEKRKHNLLQDTVESLKKEITKANFASFTQGSDEVSTTAGRLPKVPGVREFTMADLEIGEQIG